MHGPPQVGWLLVVLSAATGSYCLLRMRTAPPGRRSDAGADALMGWGMAVMSVPHSVLDQRAWGPTLFAVVFGGAAVHALSPPLRRGGGHGLHHLLGSLAMVYMGLAMAGGTAGHPGHAAHGSTTGGLPLLTGALLAYFAGYVVRSGVRLVPVAAGGAAAWSQRQELAEACRLTMGIGMCAMLLTL